MPSIQAHISTSSPVLDFDSPGPFVITINLFLEHHCEVTFLKESSSLFDGSILNKGGLTFTDTATGIDAHRNIINICTFNSDGDLKKDTKQNFTTLRPGQKHTITAHFTRMESRVTDYVDLPTFTTLEEHKEYVAAIEKLPKVWKWWKTNGLDNGTTYRVGIGEKASIKLWLEGSKEELLSKPLAKRNVDSMRKEPVRFHISQTGCFAVQRPDTDGSLNWP